jgi:hypothetical protein
VRYWVEIVLTSLLSKDRMEVGSYRIDVRQSIRLKNQPIVILRLPVYGHFRIIHDKRVHEALLKNIEYLKQK